MTLTYLILALSAPTQAVGSYSDILDVSGDAVDVRVDGQLYPAGWKIGPDTKTRENFNVPEIGPSGRQTVCLESKGRSACRDYGVGEVVEIVVRHNERVIKAVFTGKGPDVRFDADYIQSHRGSVRVETPPAYELVNIAIALTPAATIDSDLVVTNTDYYKAVERQFGPWRGHPAIVALDRLLVARALDYHRIKMSGVTLDMASDGTLSPSKIYFRVWNSDNMLWPIADLLSDFSKRSKFPAFFAAHRPIYDDQAATLLKKVGVERMLGWLKHEFPTEPDYDAVRILVSPLVGHNQSLEQYSNGGFGELQPHVNFPYPSKQDNLVSAAALPVLRGLILFTELNHGFIAGPEKAFAAELTPIFADRNRWVRKDSSADTYSGNAVFTEMMNWGLFSLYAIDQAPPADHPALLDHVVKTMQHRGFTRFSMFQRELLKLRRASPEKTVAQLYPQIVAWCEAERRMPD